MAGDPWCPGAEGLDLPCELVRPAEAVRQGAPAAGRGRSIGLDDSERVEAPRDGRRVVQSLQHVSDRGGIGTADLALDETGDEHAVCEADHLRADAEARGHERSLVLVLPVDPEQGRVLAPDPQNERFAVDADLEVAVGDPAAERLDLHVLSGPELPDRLFDAHARS